MSEQTVLAVIAPIFILISDRKESKQNLLIFYDRAPQLGVS